MNRNIAIASLVLAAGFAGSAFAETPNVYPGQAFTSTKSRAEVQAELAAYQQAGVNPWSIRYNPLASFKSTLTREAVAAEAAGAHGTAQALYGEDSGSAHFAQARQPGFTSSTVAGQPANAQ